MNMKYEELLFNFDFSRARSTSGPLQLNSLGQFCTCWYLVCAAGWSDNNEWSIWCQVGLARYWVGQIGISDEELAYVGSGVKGVGYLCSDEACFVLVQAGLAYAVSGPRAYSSGA